VFRKVSVHIFRNESLIGVENMRARVHAADPHAQSKMSFRNMGVENTCGFGESEGPFAPEFHFCNKLFHFMV
jgi:hypothetical protein